ncbi:outer membrane beta-barrel protein [Fulvivirgaceae bacterium PWU4]|uniref:Outer membrane beta-barrel protein n=1 Tax=Chryseosolibacter histidini TaxID=2782349 RepID=A0AAP2DQ48_9BACT|nr:outer membrane beta-barrel protein [Chryseosolibacter histidini]MBT1699514.1 outer membrane beta-barrel protein [Chryseosolibacter histidini]
MKKLTVILSILCIKTPACAQVLIALVFGDKLQTEKLTFGLVVSPTFSTISNLSGDYRSGLGLGLYFDIKISKNFFLHPEAAPKASLGVDGLSPYSTGNDSLDALFVNGVVNRKLKAISLPLLCKYRIKGLLFAEAGPQINWILRVRDVYTAEINGNELTYETELKNEFTRFEVGLAGGLECKLKKDKGMGLGLRYFHGLNDIWKSREGKQVNQALQINISIPIGTGKAQNAGKN